MTERQTLVVTGITRSLSSALRGGFVDEVILHQVPVLLGAGRPFFLALPEHVHLRLASAVPTAAVTHLHYEVAH